MPPSGSTSGSAFSARSEPPGRSGTSHSSQASTSAMSAMSVALAPALSKAHGVDRWQMRRQAAPAVARVFRDPQAAGGRADREPVARLVDREAVAIDEIVGMLLRQPAAQNLERAAAIARARDDEYGVERDAPLDLVRRHEPGGVGVLGMHRGGDAELERRDRRHLLTARRAIGRAE